jgi:hypothetical protein
MQTQRSKPIENLPPVVGAGLGIYLRWNWGYALALLAYFREEESPAWINHLTLNVKSDFKQSMKFIIQNEDKLLIR